MRTYGSKQHMNLIKQTVDELRNDGYNAVNCYGVIPDAVATKNNKLYAVEILLMPSINNWNHSNIVEHKKRKYSMFDDIIFRVDKRSKHKDHVEYEIKNKDESKLSKAERIVNDYIVDLQTRKNIDNVDL